MKREIILHDIREAHAKKQRECDEAGKKPSTAHNHRGILIAWMDELVDVIGDSGEAMLDFTDAACMSLSKMVGLDPPPRIKAHLKIRLEDMEQKRRKGDSEETEEPPGRPTW